MKKETQNVINKNVGDKKKTRYGRILEHLQKYGAITSLECIYLYGYTRLAAIIHELRRDGYNIISETICSKNRYGDNVHFSKYILIEKEQQ